MAGILPSRVVRLRSAPERHNETSPSRRLRTRYLLLLVPFLLAPVEPPDGGTELDGGTEPDGGTVQPDGGSVPGTPVRVKFVETPVQFLAGGCEPVSVEIQDAAGQPASFPADSVAVMLYSSHGSTGRFYSGEGCSSPISSAFFPAGSSRQRVWFRDTLTPEVTLYASESTHGLGTAQHGPIPVLPGALWRLSVEGFPSFAYALEEHPFSVIAYDEFDNRKTDFAGQVEITTSDFDATVSLSPASPYNFTVQDGGRAVFKARFSLAGVHSISAKDRGTSVTSFQGDINIVAAQPVRFELWELPTDSVVAGRTFTVRVKAFDAAGNLAAGYLGRVRFTSTDPQANLPADTLFNSEDGGMKYVSLSLATAGTWSLVVEDAGNPQVRGEASITVSADAYDHIAVVPLPSDSVEACAEARLALRAEDRFGNLVPGTYPVQICADPSTSSATLGENDLALAKDASAGCWTGTLSTTGYATWRNPRPEQVTFQLTDGAAWSTSLLVTWGPAIFNPAYSTLVFQENYFNTPQLRSYVGQLGLWFEPRDTCGNLVRLPTDRAIVYELGFSGDPPLFFSQPVEQSDGRWAVNVRLPQCPTTGDELLRIWPTINREPIVTPGGTKLKQVVQPVCLPSDVLISLRTEPEGLKEVAPGAVVSFVVEVKNTGQVPFAQGLLMITAKDLTLIHASVEGRILEQRNGGFVLPDLAPGATLTIWTKAQAPVASALSVGATVWFASSEGAALTEQLALTLDSSAGIADVGCGCQAGPLSSQLLPWLALLAAASRTRARLRRLRPGERIDR